MICNRRRTRSACGSVNWTTGPSCGRCTAWALTMWRLRQFPAAELTRHNMLWLNPLDNQGARELLPAVSSGQEWQDRQ